MVRRAEWSAGSWVGRAAAGWAARVPGSDGRVPGSDGRVPEPTTDLQDPTTDLQDPTTDPRHPAPHRHPSPNPRDPAADDPNRNNGGRWYGVFRSLRDKVTTTQASHAALLHNYSHPIARRLRVWICTAFPQFHGTRTSDPPDPDPELSGPGSLEIRSRILKIGSRILKIGSRILRIRRRISHCDLKASVCTAGSTMVQRLLLVELLVELLMELLV